MAENMTFASSPKVCDFTWRACWDIIPHGSNLALKGIPNYGNCKRCEKNEYLMHILFGCTWAKAFWQMTECDVGGGAFPSFREALDGFGRSSERSRLNIL